MNIKGTAFLARKKTVTDKFGEQAWGGFLREQINVQPYFATPVMASTSIPIEHFLKFQEALVKRFFRGNSKAYWDKGAASAQWSLTEGPYRAVLDKRDLDALIQTLPSIWATYYDDGKLLITVEDKILHVRIVDLPVWHVSIELMVVGYLHRALELFCKRKVAWKQVSGGAPGSNVHYTLFL